MKHKKPKSKTKKRDRAWDMCLRSIESYMYYYKTGIPPALDRLLKLSSEYIEEDIQDVTRNVVEACADYAVDTFEPLSPAEGFVLLTRVQTLYKQYCGFASDIDRSIAFAACSFVSTLHRQPTLVARVIRETMMCMRRPENAGEEMQDLSRELNAHKHICTCDRCLPQVTPRTIRKQREAVLIRS